jgi:DMSO/TMAO reductase YedYZ molybdopterin-dependent catalytic subunit
VNHDDLVDEGRYDRLRMAQWLAGRARGDGLSRRTLLRLSAGAALAGVPGLGGPPGLGGRPGLGGPRTRTVGPDAPPARTAATVAPAVDPPPIVKPLPPELFEVFGTNAEMRWEAMRDQGYLVPIDRFFVRNHTRTPRLDVDSWRLNVFGSGLRGAPTAANPVRFTYRELRALPSTTVTAFVECAGNGRSFYTTQQNQVVSGTAWKLGAVGVARWRGVRLSTVLRHAGITAAAVDVMPQGLDPNFVSGGVDLGPVRRPLSVAKALRDVLIAYEMNGEPLPPDHGFPVRLVVPSWIGIASIKWLGQIEVSDEPLFSPWNTQFYRLFGPDQPVEGTIIDRQVTKSAFELARGAELPAGQTTVLRGRSWSGHGPIRRVEVSTDAGVSWRPAHRFGPDPASAWQRWELRWHPTATGPYTLLARATDAAGVTQPDIAPFNTLGYLFGGVVRHPVSVI